MMRYKETAKEPAAVARELNVRYVLDGSVRRAGTSLRLTARLIDSADASVIWSEKLSGVVDDIFAMQERVSRTIVDALQLKLTPQEEKRLVAHSIDDLAAYESYLQAKQAMWSFTPQSLDRARMLLEQAVTRVGDSPRLITALATVHLNYLEAGAVDAGPHLAAVELCIERLTELDPESSSRHALTGLMARRRGHVRESIASLSRAHELDPNNSDIVAYLTLSLIMAGQDDRARELALLGVRLDPLTPLFQIMPAFCDLCVGRASDAVGPYRRLVESDPMNPVTHFFMLFVHLEVGDVASATAEAECLARDFPGTVFGDVGAMFAREIRLPLAKRHVELTPTMREVGANSETFDRAMAHMLAALGAVDQAIDALEHAVQLGNSHYPYLAHRSPSLAPLRGHPRFERLLEVVRGRWERGGTSAADLAATPPAATKPAAPDRRSVAVLPFANLSPDPENEFFADGITDDLISQIAKVRGLRVISRTSVMRFKDADLSLATIGAELGVAAVIEGTVRRAGNRVRVVGKLVDVASDEHLWSETYDRELDDVFAVQSDIALKIAQALEANLSAGDRQRLTKPPTADAAAYDLYLLGRHHANRRNDESIRRGIGYFEQALARDPTYAAAHAGLAEAYVFAALGYASIAPAAGFAKAQAAAAAAIALDPASAEGLCALGLVAINRDWDIGRAREAYERSIAQNPNYAPGHQLVAWCHFAVGDYLGAVRAQERALALDPLNVSLIAESGWPYSYARLHELAAERYARAIELDPGNGLAHYNLAMTLHGRGMLDEAVAECERALALMGRAPWVIAQLAMVLVDRGDKADVDALFAELEALRRAGIAANLSIALVADARGDVRRALDALEQAVVNREPLVFGLGLSAYLPLVNARKVPEFQGLMDRIGAKPHDVAGQQVLLLAHHGRAISHRGEVR